MDRSAKSAQLAIIQPQDQLAKAHVWRDQPARCKTIPLVFQNAKIM